MQAQLETECREQFGESCKTEFSGTPVFECIERSAADTRFPHQLGLAELEFLAAAGDLVTDGVEA